MDKAKDAVTELCKQVDAYGVKWKLTPVYAQVYHNTQRCVGWTVTLLESGKEFSRGYKTQALEDTLEWLRCNRSYLGEE